MSTDIASNISIIAVENSTIVVFVNKLLSYLSKAIVHKSTYLRFPRKDGNMHVYAHW